ncbi:CbiX/SirB N-terminal domain-containing protein [Halosegnis sp.]|uniref:CbiX/SirB N-terminal domain-containing protein n=1 Tax=Halosegnis sp. TaxID=2864959 RepID=UPI0035D4D316
MPRDTLLLVGRAAGDGPEVFETHRRRLADRTSFDAVEVATYEEEPVRELRERFATHEADRVHAVPMCLAHTHDTVDAVPRALSYLPGEVHYCDPVGRNPAVTEVLAERARGLVDEGEDASLVLVGFGSSSTPHQRRAAEYHAGRLRETAGYGQVVTCYLLQNPTVECVRYEVSNPRSVAVPLFVAPSPATDERIPEQLELSRGGIEYADPLGTHPRVTDAVHAEAAKGRVLAAAAPADAAGGRPPVATDGEG